MKFHILAVSTSLLLGAGLSALQPGNFFIGWIIFSFLFLLSFYIFRFASQWSTRLHPSTFNPSTSLRASIQLVILLAFLLRLALGLTFYFVLPLQPDAGEDHHNGYIYFDAYRRDSQAWDLAQSDQPIWESFNKTHYSDQYGGLLAILTFGYRYLSPDAHRPLLPILLAAMFAALGIPFLWKSANELWGEKIALFAIWMYALYPESVLLGSSQMREPFLTTFMAMALWGFVERGADWQSAVPVTKSAADYLPASQARGAIAWIVIGFLGMLLLSPAVALLTIVLFAGWMWVTREHGRVSWIALLVTGFVFVAGLYLLAWGVEREQPFGASPIGTVMNWTREAVKWDTYQLERGSGWVQKLFNEMPEGLHPLFVMIYGLCQPVLPAAFVEPTTLTLRLLGIFRAAGWYALVPLLFYAPFGAARLESGAKRRLWYWLIALVWLWSIVASLRGGADQWDNPRYRAILIAVQASVAGFAWVNRDRWLTRWILVEVVFLAFFTQWYISRYAHIGGQIPFGIMVGLIFVCAGSIIGGGWWRDRRSSGGGA